MFNVITISTDNHPTLSQLKDVMRNETNIIIHWYDIGLELLDDGILDLIKDGASGNAEKCCTRMFKTWLDRNPDASWNQLIGTLKKIKLNAAAESVKSYSMLTYTLYTVLLNYH